MEYLEPLPELSTTLIPIHVLPFEKRDYYTFALLDTYQLSLGLKE